MNTDSLRAFLARTPATDAPHRWSGRRSTSRRLPLSSGRTCYVDAIIGAPNGGDSFGLGNDQVEKPGHRLAYRQASRTNLSRTGLPRGEVGRAALKSLVCIHSLALLRPMRKRPWSEMYTGRYLFVRNLGFLDRCTWVVTGRQQPLGERYNRSRPLPTRRRS